MLDRLQVIQSRHLLRRLLQETLAASPHRWERGWQVTTATQGEAVLNVTVDNGNGSPTVFSVRVSTGKS